MIYEANFILFVIIPIAALTVSFITPQTPWWTSLVLLSIFEACEICNGQPAKTPLRAMWESPTQREFVWSLVVRATTQVALRD